MYIKSTLVALLLLSSFQQANAQKRLYAHAHATYGTSTYNPEDSTAYGYTGTRGLSTPKYNIPEFMIPYDSKNDFTYNTSSKAYDNTAKSTKTFDANDKVLTQIDQTNSGGTWSNDMQAKLSYSTTPDTVLYQSWYNNNWINSSRILYTYSGVNPTVAEIQNYKFGGGGGNKWSNSRKISYSYNTGGFVINMTIQRYNKSTTAYEDSLKTDNTYDGSNNITLSITSKSTGGTWVNGNQTTYSYTSGKLQTAETKYWDPGTSTWLNKAKDTYVFTGSAMTQKTHQDFDQVSSQTYINTQQFNYTSYTVNPYTVNQTATQSWNGTKWIAQLGIDSQDRDYYAGNLGIAQTPIVFNEISVYPSPANNVLNINMSHVLPGQHISIDITNMAGEVVRTIETEADQNIMTVPVADLPSGTYVITLLDGRMINVKRFTIAR